VQVQASLGTLHRAIDCALSLDDKRAGRDTVTGGGGGTVSEEARPGSNSALEAPLAPAPAVADLMYAPGP
jgi:hypothetical protein